MDFEKLSAPFRGTQISWRVGATLTDKSKGLPLAYIDARDVMERLDDICGPAGWQATYSHAGQRVICDLSVKVGDEWVTKSNGAGSTDVEADKGAISDAFKRAAVMWGIGRYLYGLKADWVAITPKGRSYVIAPSAMGDLIRLHEKFVGGPSSPQNDAQPQQQSKGQARVNGTYQSLEASVRKLDTIEKVDAWEAAEKVIAARKSLPASWAANLTEEIVNQRNSIMDKQAAA